MATPLSGIVVTGSLDEANNQVVDGGQNTSGCANGHASGIFVKGNIPAVVQAGFNPPMLSSQLKQLGCRNMISRKAGDAILSTL